MEIGVGLSVDRDPASAAKSAINAASANIHSKKIDLAIVFSSVSLSSLGLLRTINKELDESVPIVGASGAAIISEQGIFKQGLVLMLLSFSSSVYFNIACVRDIKARTPLNAGRELAKKLLKEFDGESRDLTIIFSDGLIQGGFELISGLQENFGRSFPVVGASCADNMSFLKTYQYFNQELLTDSAVGILFGGKLNFGLGVKHGWKPLGKPHTITKCAGNVVYEIDGRPAVKMYEEYLGCRLSELQKEIKLVSVLYPIGLYLAGEEEYLLRNILSIENNGSVHFQGNVWEGCAIRLMIGTKESCLDATRQALSEAKKTIFGLGSTRYTHKTQLKNFVLVFDSASRFMLLKRDANRELEIIKNGFPKDTPIIGLYTYGEQAPLKALNYQGQTYFHNQTIAILNVGG